MRVAILLNSKSRQGEGFVPKLPTRSSAKIHKVDEIKGGLLSQRMLKEYQQDGVIAIRGLVDKELLDRLDVASQKYVQDHKMKKKEQEAPNSFR
jgi:hypothetical protein